jgi:hypothetical protein
MKVCGTGYTVASSATLGCRSPSEAGCATCCVQADMGCTELSWDSTGAGSTQPWYNSTQGATSCPPSCSPCASCLSRDQDLLCSLLGSPHNCDCSTVTIGSNPCATNGCACYCFNYQYLTQACPAQ